MTRPRWFSCCDHLCQRRERAELNATLELQPLRVGRARHVPSVREPRIGGGSCFLTAYEAQAVLHGET